MPGSGSVRIQSAVGLVAILALACGALVLAQEAPPAQGRGGRGGGGGGGAQRAATAEMLFKVEWVRPASQTGQVAMVQENVADPNVEVKWYGKAAHQLLTSGNPGNANAPFSVWSGECEGPFAITFRHKANNLDLSGLSKIRWTTKTSGFHVVRPVVKLTDGTLLVGDHTEMHVPMLTQTELSLSGVRWIKLDPERAVTVNSGRGNAPGLGANEIWVLNPDLTKVEEVGFADLMPASGHGTGGYIHVAGIEVYGKAVPR
jgi:hypothetical protein